MQDTCFQRDFPPYTASMGEKRQLLLLAAGMVGAYVALGWLSLISTGPDEVTLMWPATGIIYGAMLFFGYRWWVLPAVAVLALHMTVSPVPLSFIPWSVASNVFGALAGVGVVRRFAPSVLERYDISTGAGLLFGGVVFVSVSAVFGSVGMWLSGQTQLATLHTDALRWAIGDLFGIVAVTPAVLLGLQRKFRPGSAAQHHVYEYASASEQRVWAGLTFILVLAAAWLRTTEPSQALAMVGLPLAALIWGAVRMPPLRLAIVNGVISLLMVAAVNFGFAGPLPASTINATSLIAFLCVISAIPITLSLGAQQSRQAAARLLQRANTDALTGLLSRSAFEYRARNAMQQPEQWPMALAYIDLDRFRLVNDAMSHATGDELINAVAGVLRANLPPTDHLARIGGDEFAVLMPVTSRAEALARAEWLREAVAGLRFQAGEHVATPTTSIGLVTATTHAGQEFGGLLALADTACFAAKEQGGNRVQEAESGEQDIVRKSSDTMRWALRLGNALEENHFRLFCQAITPLRSTGYEPRHFEVLLRLREPGKPLILPGQFIDAAERYGLSVRLDRYVLAKTLRWFDRHPDRAREVGLCAINLSADSIQDEHFFQDVANLLATSVLRPQQVCFEITETTALSDLGRAQRFIAAARALGCRFSLDDFGTGFCSFGYLRSLDVDYFKIDGSFVREIEASSLSLAIVRSIADIGRVMQKGTIAECVESPAIAQRLRELGVDYAQGYAMGRPVDISEFFGTREAVAEIA